MANLIKKGQNFMNGCGEAGVIVSVLDSEGESYEELPIYSIKAIIIEIDNRHFVQEIDDSSLLSLHENN